MITDPTIVLVLLCLAAILLVLMWRVLLLLFFATVALIFLTGVIEVAKLLAVT